MQRGAGSCARAPLGEDGPGPPADPPAYPADGGHPLAPGVASADELYAAPQRSSGQPPQEKPISKRKRPRNRSAPQEAPQPTASVSNINNRSSGQSPKKRRTDDLLRFFTEEEERDFPLLLESLRDEALLYGWDVFADAPDHASNDDNDMLFVEEEDKGDAVSLSHITDSGFANSTEHEVAHPHHCHPTQHEPSDYCNAEVDAFESAVPYHGHDTTSDYVGDVPYAAYDPHYQQQLAGYPSLSGSAQYWPSASATPPPSGDPMLRYDAAPPVVSTRPSHQDCVDGGSDYSYLGGSCDDYYRPQLQPQQYHAYPYDPLVEQQPPLFSSYDPHPHRSTIPLQPPHDDCPECLRHAQQQQQQYLAQHQQQSPSDPNPTDWLGARRRQIDYIVAMASSSTAPLPPTSASFSSPSPSPSPSPSLSPLLSTDDPTHSTNRVPAAAKHERESAGDNADYAGYRAEAGRAQRRSRRGGRSRAPAADEAENDDNDGSASSPSSWWCSRRDLSVRLRALAARLQPPTSVSTIRRASGTFDRLEVGYGLRFQTLLPLGAGVATLQQQQQQQKVATDADNRLEEEKIDPANDPVEPSERQQDPSPRG